MTISEEQHLTRHDYNRALVPRTSRALLCSNLSLLTLAAGQISILHVVLSELKVLRVEAFFNSVLADLPQSSSIPQVCSSNQQLLCNKCVLARRKKNETGSKKFIYKKKKGCF